MLASEYAGLGPRLLVMVSTFLSSTAASSSSDEELFFVCSLLRESMEILGPNTNTLKLFPCISQIIERGKMVVRDFGYGTDQNINIGTNFTYDDLTTLLYKVLPEQCI